MKRKKIFGKAGLQIIQRAGGPRDERNMLLEKTGREVQVPESHMNRKVKEFLFRQFFSDHKIHEHSQRPAKWIKR